MQTQQRRGDTERIQRGFTDHAHIINTRFFYSVRPANDGRDIRARSHRERSSTVNIQGVNCRYPARDLSTDVVSVQGSWRVDRIRNAIFWSVDRCADAASRSTLLRS